MGLIRDSGYTLAGTVLPLAASIVTIPLYLAEIGAERYGALLIAWTLLGYFGQADFGIGRAITQRLAAMPGAPGERIADAIWSALLSAALVSGIAGAILLVAGGLFFAELFRVEAGLREELLQSLWLLALCTPVVALGGVLSGALQGLNRFGWSAASALASNLAMQVAPLAIAVALAPRLEWMIAASLGARALGIAIPAMGLAGLGLVRRGIRTSRRELAALAGFGSWVMVSALVGPFMTIGDRFVIGALAGAAAVAAYTIPLQIAARTVLLPMSLIQALFPRFAAEEERAARRRCGEATVLVGQLYAPVAIGLACLASPLLHLWLGARLDQRSILIGQIALAGFWTNALANVAYSYIHARGDPRFTAWLHLAELPVYFGLLFVLGGKWGLAGFAAAYALRCAGDAAALMIRAGVWRREVLVPLAGQALLVAAAVPVGQAFPSWPAALAGAAALAAAGAALAWWQMPAPVRERLGAIPVVGRFAA